MLRKITAAYRVLSDPLQRAAYDRHRSAHTSAFEQLGAFERERVPGVDSSRPRGQSNGVLPDAVARKLVTRHGIVCSDCGGSVRETARFCLHCGKTFTTADAEMAAETADESAPAPAQAQKTYSKLRGVWNCSNCRGVVQPQSSFCIHCGQSFGKSQS
jgi:DnaJ-class molecular chaperone